MKKQTNYSPNYRDCGIRLPFNRRVLDPFGFVLPVEKNAFRAQISTTFLKFAEACNTVIPQKSGGNIEITGVDLIALYCVLRSKPASHRWKGDTIKAEMSKLKMGKHKAQAILRLLFKEGWIRYIDLPKSGGQHSGSIMEVRFRRLPKTESGKKRKIRIDSEGKVRFFKQDGLTVVRDPKYPREFLTDDVNSGCKYGEETDSKIWSPYTLLSGMRSSDEPGLDERSSGEEYKDHEYKDHEIEGTPLIPRSETGEPDSSIPRKKTVTESSGSEASVIATDSAQSVDTASPGSDIEALANELARLGGCAAGSPADRIQFEKFLKDRIFPMLGDPLAPDIWTAHATRDWLAASLKAQILLAIAHDEKWSDGLGKSFGKRCGSYPYVDFCKILFAFDWTSQNRPTLSYLIQADTGRSNLKGWDIFKKPLIEKFNEQRLETNCSLSLLRLGPGESNEVGVCQWFKAADKRPSDFLMGEPADRDVFEWLYFMWKSFKEGQLLDRSEFLNETKKENHEKIICLLAHSRAHLAVASAMHADAKEIWGIDWCDIRSEHVAWVEHLNHRADFLNLDPVAPLLQLIEGPIDWNGSNRDGDESLAFVVAPESLPVLPSSMPPVSSEPPSIAIAPQKGSCGRNSTIFTPAEKEKVSLEGWEKERLIIGVHKFSHRGLPKNVASRKFL